MQNRRAERWRTCALQNCPIMKVTSERHYKQPLPGDLLAQRKSCRGLWCGGGDAVSFYSSKNPLLRCPMEPRQARTSKRITPRKKKRKQETWKKKCLILSEESLSISLNEFQRWVVLSQFPVDFLSSLVVPVKGKL